jgi:hypothetical protein
MKRFVEYDFTSRVTQLSQSQDPYRLFDDQVPWRFPIANPDRSNHTDDTKLVSNNLAYKHAFQRAIYMNVQRPNRWATRTTIPRLNPRLVIPASRAVSIPASRATLLPAPCEIELIQNPTDANVQTVANVQTYPKATPPTSSRSEYYTDPDATNLATWDDKQLMQVWLFTIGHYRFGDAVWYGYTDARNIDIDRVLTFGHREVEFHPTLVEYGLNRSVMIRLYDVWPSTKKTPIANDHGHERDYEHDLIEYCKAHNMLHMGYNHSNGEWAFRVDLDQVFKNENPLDLPNSRGKF